MKEEVVFPAHENISPTALDVKLSCMMRNDITSKQEEASLPFSMIVFAVWAEQKQIRGVADWIQLTTYLSLKQKQMTAYEAQILQKKNVCSGQISRSSAENRGPWPRQVLHVHCCHVSCWKIGRLVFHNSEPLIFYSSLWFVRCLRLESFGILDRTRSLHS